MGMQKLKGINKENEQFALLLVWTVQDLIKQSRTFGEIVLPRSRETVD